MYEIKTKDGYEGFSSNKEMFDFSVYSTRSKWYGNSKLLIIEKIKDETGGVAIEEFIRLNPKRYSFLVDNNKHTRAKGVNKNVVATSYSEYKDVLMNNKCIRHRMNRIQSKDHKIATYEIKKFHCLVLMTKDKFKTMDMMV